MQFNLKNLTITERPIYFQQGHRNTTNEYENKKNSH